MKTADFDYELPSEYIAQRPADPRDSSRLLVLDRASGELSHAAFRDLPQFLEPHDVLVLNETRVLPVRLTARRVPTGGRVEVLLLKKLEPRRWEALVGGRGLRTGQRLQIEGGPPAEIVADLGGPRRQIELESSISPMLDRIGQVPLPPYIKEPLRHPSEYQTVYARSPGSAAAPPAGLHFTPGLLKAIKAKGTSIQWVTLHIGLDTFAPVGEDDPRGHQIHSEWCQVTRTAAEGLTAAVSSGGRVIAVGTTTIRAIETAARRSEGSKRIGPFSGPTDLYILPGFKFRLVDAIVTNFHLPRSTLIMMISAFAGREKLLHAYEIAKQEGYRFYSFGDAMLIL